MNDNFNKKTDDLYESVSFGRPRTLAWSLVSFVTGLISIFVCFFGWAAIALGAIAVTSSVISRKTLGYFDKMSVGGIILGIFGAVSGIIVLVAISLAGEEFWQTLLDAFREVFSGADFGNGGM